MEPSVGRFNPRLIRKESGYQAEPLRFHERFALDYVNSRCHFRLKRLLPVLLTS